MQQVHRLPPLLADLQSQYWQRLLDCPVDGSLLESNETDIKAILALSDFVAESIISMPDILDPLLVEGLLHQADVDMEHALAEIISQVDSETGLQRALRRFRRLHMVRIAWRDLLNMQDIESSLLQVSELANQLITQAYQWLYQDFCRRYGIPLQDGMPQPMLIIGMGKLGGRELNFSSDIDLIFTFPSAGSTQGGRKSLEHQQFFTRLAQKLITALNQVTTDGQVYRVDMRLRPFGESGPLVANFPSLEDYYQEQGREWERYAMVKGRILNPLGPFADELRAILKPFTFRRYLDYGAIDSLRKMKMMINQELRRRDLHANIKLGQGGIREVEFIAQSFQLIRGGREPALRHASLLTTLEQLAELGMMEPEASEKLRQSYLFLRKTEHCLQQFQDRQTQLLPDNETDQQRLCLVMKVADYPAFLHLLETHRNYVHQQFTLLIGDEEESSSQQQHTSLSVFGDLWQLELDPQEKQKMLAEWLTADQAQQLIEQIEQFKQQLNKRRIGPRGLETLNKLMPYILTCCLPCFQAGQHDLFSRLSGVLNAIMGRTTYLDLLNENRAAADQLIRLCEASPWIAEQIARFPLLLDELLNPAQLYQPTPFTEYKQQLREAMLRIEPDDLEQQMDVMRQFKLSQQLKIAAADVTGALPVMKVSDHLTYLAEAMLDKAVQIGWQQTAARFGTPNGIGIEQCDFAVFGYGKLGGIELGYGSDLDLVFVHNSSTKQVTTGKKSISAQQFYLKLGQRVMHLLNTKTVYGELYEADLRLRPSGNAGLLVCHIDGFETYQQQEAWVWEHQALVRARYVWGGTGLQTRFQHIRTSILCQHRELPGLQSAVSDMREKMREHLSSPSDQGINLKQDKGGIADIEFLVQYWVLGFSHQYPELAVWSDNVRILESLMTAEVIQQDTAQSLIEAYLYFRNTNHRLALQQRSHAVADDQIEALRAKVIDIWQSVFSARE